VQEIEGKEHDSVGRLVNGRAQGVEVVVAILVLDHDLAIDQRSLTGEPAEAAATRRYGPLQSVTTSSVVVRQLSRRDKGLKPVKPSTNNSAVDLSVVERATAVAPARKL
jgi:hypothetical protein